MQYERKLVHRAGVIPYYVENGEVFMMFMKPSNTEFGGDQFQLAKGRVEEDEDTKTAALREAREELGLFLGNVDLVDDLGVFMGRTTVFVAKIRDKDMFGSPDFETEEVAWMTEDQFTKTGRPLHLHVVQAAARRIRLLEDL